VSGAADPAAVLRRYHAAIDVLDFEAIEGMFATDAVYVSGGVGGRIEGRAAILAAFRAYFAEFGDQVSEDIEVEALADRARSVWKLTATSALSGERIERHGVETITLDALGLIVQVEVDG
jgi:ketosteroid isomerase-like protein